MLTGVSAYVMLPEAYEREKSDTPIATRTKLIPIPPSLSGPKRDLDAACRRR